MAITLAVTPSSGTGTKTAFRFDVTGLPANDTTSFDSTKSPVQPEIRYYFEFSEGGIPKGTSYQFAPDVSTGKHSWQGVIMPDPGTYTISLKKVSGNTTLASANFTVA